MSIFPKSFSALITPRGGASSKAESTVYSNSYSYGKPFYYLLVNVDILFISILKYIRYLTDIRNLVYFIRYLI